MDLAACLLDHAGSLVCKCFHACRRDFALSLGDQLSSWGFRMLGQVFVAHVEAEVVLHSRNFGLRSVSYWHRHYLLVPVVPAILSIFLVEGIAFHSCGKCGC